MKRSHKILILSMLASIAICTHAMAVEEVAGGKTDSQPKATGQKLYKLPSKKVYTDRLPQDEGLPESESELTYEKEDFGGGRAPAIEREQEKYLAQVIAQLKEKARKAREEFFESYKNYSDGVYRIYGGTNSGKGDSINDLETKLKNAKIKLIKASEEYIAKRGAMNEEEIKTIKLRAEEVAKKAYKEAYAKPTTESIRNAGDPNIQKPTMSEVGAKVKNANAAYQAAYIHELLNADPAYAEPMQKEMQRVEQQIAKSKQAYNEAYRAEGIETKRNQGSNVLDAPNLNTVAAKSKRARDAYLKAFKSNEHVYVLDNQPVAETNKTESTQAQPEVKVAVQPEFIAPNKPPVNNFAKNPEEESKEPAKMPDAKKWLEAIQSGLTNFTTKLKSISSPASSEQVDPNFAPEVASTAVEVDSSAPAATAPTAADEKNNSIVEEGFSTDLSNFLGTGRIPKYIHVKTTGYNVRKDTEHLEYDYKGNIDFQTVADTWFAVTNVRPTENGYAVGINVNDQERWIYVPKKPNGQFEFCEAGDCLAAMAGQLNQMLANTDSKTQDAECGFTALESEKNIVEIVGGSRPAKEVEKLEENIPKPEPIQDHANSANCVPDKRTKKWPNFRNYRNIKELKKAFINYLLPYALEVQEATGYPASVIIAQSALETGWGRSNVFQKTGNAFGHSCVRQGRTYTYKLTVNGEVKKVKGLCNLPNVLEPGRFIMSFDTPQDNIYTYASNILEDKNHYYDDIRNLVKSARPGVAHYSEVVNGLDNYAPNDSNYQSTLLKMIKYNKLDKLELKTLCK